MDLAPRAVVGRARNLFKFRLERWLLRGMGSRLAFIAAVIIVLSVLGGLAASGFGFRHPGEAIWWAFLRLTDPGYLGDDKGFALRVVSTLLTVAGYVVFLGALVAILTQWLNQTMRRLELGLTPIAQNDHVLVLGWTDRTATILRELLMSEGRVSRFLARHGAKRLSIAVLAEEVTPELQADLRDRLGPLYRDEQIILRSGSPLRLEHLRRVDFVNAAAIVLPMQSGGGQNADLADAHAVKTLLTVSRHGESISDAELPLIVGEIADGRRLQVALATYRGAIELVATERILGRLLAHVLRNPGVSWVYSDMLDHAEGISVYVREHPALVGRRFGDLYHLFPQAVPLGLVRRAGRSFRSMLNPPAETLVEPGDRVALLSGEHEEAEPDLELPVPASAQPATPQPARGEPKPRRVLVLGWGRRVVSVLRELEAARLAERFEVDVLAVVPAAERERELARLGVRLERVAVRQLEGDATVPGDVAALSPWEYDNVLLAGSDWLQTGEEADARTVTSYLLLRRLLERAPRRPHLLVELMDDANEALIDEPSTELLVSSLTVGHILAQVTLRPELRAVYDELLGVGGASINLAPCEELGADAGSVSFGELQTRAARRGEILVGALFGGEGGRSRLELNPQRSIKLPLRAGDHLVLLSHAG